MDSKKSKMNNISIDAKDSKYKKLIENMKESKTGNKIAKLLTVTSIADIIQVNKWWEQEAINNSNNEDEEERWKSLEHKGVVFAPKYEPHGIKIRYKGEEVKLTPDQEELATFWAHLMDNDLSTKEIPRKNFFKAFKKALDDEKYAFATINDFDFTPIYDYIQKTREKNKNRTPEEKKTEKFKKQKIAEQYGYALVDGMCEKISNFLVEPPGIFRGRGDHPQCGKIKPRILPEHITINIGQNDLVPVCPLPGHCWKEVTHNNEATWLTYYKEDKASKYVFLAANSKFKGMSDFKKYEKAKRLKTHIGKIREDYNKKLEEKDVENRQLGVATYLIDKLALRVGNEKGDDEADTVGCCSLRVEHIKIDSDNHIILDFLGKDSMRYYNRILVDENVYINLAKFVKGKKDDDNLFESINASKLNDYLKSLMDGLSAKVFRTYNASITLQCELDKKTFHDNDQVDTKIAYYNEANKEVAILCNHQKTVSKNFNVTSEAMQNNLKDHINYLLELTEHYTNFDKKSKKKEKKESKNEKKEDKEDKEDKGKLKKVFPDDKEKTKKIMDSVTKKIAVMEAKMKNRVKYFIFIF